MGSPRRLLVGLSLVAVACAGPASQSPTTVGEPGEGSVPPSTAPATAAPTWAEPEAVAPGFTLDALGPVDPGVVSTLDIVAPGTEVVLGAPGLRLVTTACRLVAPAHWVIEGEATVSGGGPVTATTGVTWAESDMATIGYLTITVARSGPFALAYDRLADPASRPDDGSDWQQAELAQEWCGLDDGHASGTSVPVGHADRLPGWQAPPDTVQGYAVGTTRTDGADLRARLAGDVWLGVRYPFAELWLPADPSAYGELGVANAPACAAVSYRSAAGVEVVHLDGTCQGSPVSTDPVADAAGWEWVARSAPAAVARRPLADGQLEVRGSDRAGVAAVIAQLHPYHNLVSSRPSGPATAEAAAAQALALLTDGADPPPRLSERGRVPTADGEVIVYTGVTEHRCDGCPTRTEWYAVATRRAGPGWTATAAGGGEWDECLTLSYGGSSDHGYDTVAVAGDPTWTIEVWNDGAWTAVPTFDGVWAVLGDHSSASQPPVVRALDAAGTPQRCTITPATPG